MAHPRYTAVLDRFEEQRAVLLLERDGEQIEELVVPTELLPPAGREQDAIFTVRVDSDTLTTITYDAEATEKRSDSAQDRFDSLSRSLSDAQDSAEDEG